MKPPAPVVVDYEDLARRLAPRDVDARRLSYVLEASAVDARELDARLAARDAAAREADEARRAWENAASSFRAGQQSRAYRGQRASEAGGALGSFLAGVPVRHFGALEEEHPDLGAWRADLDRVLAAGVELQTKLARSAGQLPEVDEGPLARAQQAAAEATAAADLAQLRLDALAAPLIAVAKGRAA